MTTLITAAKETNLPIDLSTYPAWTGCKRLFMRGFVDLGGCYPPTILLDLHKYLLLAEFSVRTVNYGPSFFPSIYGPSAKRAGHKSMGKNDDP